MQSLCSTSIGFAFFISVVLLVSKYLLLLLNHKQSDKYICLHFIKVFVSSHFIFSYRFSLARVCFVFNIFMFCFRTSLGNLSKIQTGI